MMRWLLVALDLVLLALTGLVAWELGETIAGRFPCQLDLEWMEGATLVAGDRLRRGLPYYTLPTPDYIPFIYPPLYAWTLGMLGHVVPMGYQLGRGVSIVATLAAAGAAVFAARGAGARWGLAVGCAGLYLSCYRESGAFYDLVRTDSTTLALLSWSLALGARSDRRAVLTSAALLALAFASKQNVAMLGVPMLAGVWLRDGRRRAMAFAGVSVGLALAQVVVLEVASGGLYLVYTVVIPATHQMVVERLVPGAQKELWQALPVTTTAILLVPLWLRRSPYWAGVAGMALVMVSLMRGHGGGFINVLMPMFWVLAVLPAVAMGAARVAWAPVVAAVVVAAGLWKGRDPLHRFVPAASELRNAANLIDELRTLDEPILLPHAPWYPVLAGKAPSFALIALWDIDHPRGPLRAYVQDIERAMEEHYWATIITPDAKLGFGLRDHYQQARKLRALPTAPRSGWQFRLRWVYEPRGS
jgi:hypothetical protein